MPDPLLHAYIIDAEGRVQSLDLAGIRSWKPADGILWAHFDANSRASFDWLVNDSGVPKLVPEALMALETRPRASAIADGLLLVLRGVNLNPGAEPEDMVSIRLWIEEHRIISTRRRKLLSVGDAVESLAQRPPSGTADLVLRIVDRLNDRINDSIDDLEERVAELENSVLSEPGHSLRARLSELRREAISLRRYLAPQREALGRMQTEPMPWFSDFDRMRVREIYDRLVRLVEDLDAIRERATVVHEELVSLLSDQLNQRMYLLSIVAALFLPLSFLTGLLGINVGGIPGAESPLGFTAFTGILTVLLSLQIWYFVRKKWF